tara:strand:- start:133 stop:408 length:276 start_codon:yes stop_codon:yes gene_type:complete
MPMTPVSKRRQIINYLTNSNGGLIESEARNRFGIKSLSSMMSSIKKQLECNGNWEVETVKTPRGKTRYFVYDTHPTQRVYGFDRQGNRYAL